MEVGDQRGVDALHRLEKLFGRVQSAWTPASGLETFEIVRRRLFQPFATDRPGGVGMGLALAHRIVSMHGGTLTLEPREGGGTVARVTFARERFAAP